MDEVSSPAPRPGWLERLSQLLLREPENLSELADIIHSAFERNP